MVNSLAAHLDVVFAALADPTRRAILARLATGEASLTELARPFHISLPGVHKHLRVLARAGLLVQGKYGRVRRCRLRAIPMKDAARWIERYRRFWEHRLDALSAYLEATEPPGPRAAPSGNTSPTPLRSEPSSASRRGRSAPRGRHPRR